MGNAVIVRMWAARWQGLDLVQILLTTRQGTKVNLDVGRAIARQLVRDLTRTDADGDDTHELHSDRLAVPIVLERDDAIGLRNGLVTLLDRGPLASPPEGVFKLDLRLRVAPLVQIITPQTARWV